MDLRRLEAFVKVFEHRSFSKAGKEIYLSQPTVSAHVAALEREVGVRLFDRLGRTVLPTPAGEVLYRYAREVFATLATATAELSLLRDKVAGELSLGGSTIPAHYLLPGAMAGFTERYPEVQLALTVGDSAEITARVASGELLVGVVGARDVNSELTYTELVRDSLVFIAPSDPSAAIQKHLSEDGSVALENLARLPWISREDGSGTRKAFEAGLLALGMVPATLNTVLTVGSTQGLLACVGAGLGISVTSRLAAAEGLASGRLRELTVPGLALARSFYCVHDERRHVFPAARFFVEHLVEYTASLASLASSVSGQDGEAG